jgi:hypothetical protein
VNFQPQSPLQDPRDDNPFASPFVTTPASYTARNRADRDPPGLAKAMAILDLLFYAIRVGAIIFVLAAVENTLKEALELADALAWVEIGSGVAMTIIGVVAAIGILMGATWAAPAGWMTVACTLVSIGAGVAQLLMGLAEPGVNALESAPFLVGALIAFFVRVCLLIAYAAGLVKFAAWIRRREEAAMQW